MIALSPMVLRTAIVAELKAKMPHVRSIEAHGGTFTEDELKRHAVNAPALRVAILGHGRAQNQNSGEWQIPVHVAVVVLAKDEAKEGHGRIDRDEAASALATAVSLVVAGNRFDLSGVSRPSDVQAKNEYSGPIDKVGLALWQVTWTQDITLGETVEEAVAALSELWINGAPFDAPADPVKDAPNAPVLGTPVGDLS